MWSVFGRLLCVVLLGSLAMSAESRSSLFVGTQFFRPPNPRAEDLDRDLGRISETGLEVVRAWVFWAKVNPRPGVWDWSDYDRLFDAAEKHRVKVLLQFMPDVAPYWFEDKYPQTRFVNKDGSVQEFHAVGMAQMGGWPGPCFHNAPAKAAGEEFMRRTVEHYKGRAGLYGYDVWNEAAIQECYCRSTEAQFQSWLRQRYGQVAALNRKYGTSYEDFSEVHIPKRGVYGNMFDYAEFLHSMKSDHMRWRAETTRAADPRHPVISHWIGGPLLTWEADAWMLPASLDKWGTSSYLGGPPITPAGFHEIALQFNTARDSAQGKPWWLAEHTGGPVWTGLGYALTTEAESQMRTLLAFSFGAEASFYWQWKPEIYGEEAPQFGLTGFDGELTSRTEAVARICRMLKAHKPVFDRLEWQPPEVGLLWDPRGAMFERQNGPKEVAGSKHFHGIYNALIDSGYDVRILNTRVVAASGIPTGIKVLFAPFQMFDRPGLAGRLKSWIQNGGTVFAGPLFGLFDADTYLNKTVPPPPLAAVFGARHEQTWYPSEPSLQVRNPPTTLKGNLLMETFQLSGAEALGVWNGRPALTTNNYGRGRAILCGAYIGGDGSGGLPHLLRAVCQRAGAEPRATATEECLVRTARSGADQVLFVFNPFDQSKRVELRLRAPGSGPVIDLMTGSDAARIDGRNSLEVQLAPKETKVLHVKLTR